MREQTAQAGIAFYDNDRVGVVTLADEPANTLTPALLGDVGAALDVFEAREGRVLVLCSALRGVFASGGDVEHLSRTDSTGFVSYMHAMREIVARLAGLGAPCVAAIDGSALGGGLELALACALRVAGAEARLGLPQVKLGVIPAAGGTQRLPRLIGHGKALDLLVTGRTVQAPEAYAIGLVDRLVPQGGAHDAALELARDIASVSWPAVGAARRAAAAAERPFPQGMAVEAREALALFERGEAQEGFAAFLDKRPPKFA